MGFHRESFQAVGALHVPDPGLARWEMLRAGQPANLFSITGVIHTLCSESVFNAMADLVTAPLQIGIGVGVAKIGSQFESAAHRWMLYVGATLAVVALMGVAHVLISRRRSKHRPPRAPMRWLAGFASKVVRANPLRGKVRA